MHSNETLTMSDLKLSNILPEGSHRKRKRPDRFVDREDWQQEWSKLLLEDVPEDEIDAALLDEDFSEEDDDGEEDRASSFSEDSAGIEHDDCVMLQDNDEDYVVNDDEEESSESDLECSDDDDEFLTVQAGEDAPTSDEASETKTPLQKHLLPPAEQALPSFVAPLCDAQAPTCAVSDTCFDDEETAAWKLFHEHCNLSESDLKEENETEVYNVQMAHGAVSGQKIKGVWRYWFSDGCDGIASRPAKYTD